MKPGAVRIASTSFGTTGWNGQIMDVAFRNPDGSTALVVHNENDDPRRFAVRRRPHFDYTLPGGALATFTWPAAALRRPAYVLLPMPGATATATPTGENPAPRRRGRLHPLDQRQAQAPASTCRSTSARPTSFRRVAIDSGGNLGDYARAWQLSASDDGTTWRALASGRAPASSPTSTFRGRGPATCGSRARAAAAAGGASPTSALRIA